MSLIHFKYLNEIDSGTIFRYSSQLDGLPAVNIQNNILKKKWRTDSGFVITKYNTNFPFRDTSTGAVKSFTIASGTYTGSGLASVIQTSLDSNGDYTDHSATYNSSTEKFTIARQATSTGIFSILWQSTATVYQTPAILLGFNRTDLTGSYAYTSSNTTLGNEHEIIVQFTSTQSVNTLIIDSHNFATGTVIRLRGSKATATVYSGGWNETSSISKSSTIDYNSGTISVEFTATSIKSLQLYFYDRSQSYSEIGRIWAGTYFEPELRSDNEISFRVKNQIHRSSQVEMQAGTVFFDKKDKIKSWIFKTDPLDKFLASATETEMKSMLEYVGNDRVFYISWDSNEATSTVYGFLTNDAIVYERLGRTHVFNIDNLEFREQL